MKLQTVGTILLLFSLISCSSSNNENTKSKFETIPDGFRQTKLLQKIPDETKKDAITSHVGNYTIYQTDKKDNGNILDTSIKHVSFYTDNEILQRVTISLDEVLAANYDQLKQSAYTKFGYPDNECTQKITLANGSTIDNNVLRWTKGDYALDILTNNTKKSAAILIETKDFMKKGDSNKISPSIKDVNIECTKFSPPKKADKDGF